MNFDNTIDNFLNPVIIRWYARHEGVKIPTKRDEDVAYDIYTDLKTYFILNPHETYAFPTGLSVVLPQGYWLNLRERGSTAKYGLSVRAGVVDTGYRGEIFVALTNISDAPVVFNATEEDKVKLEAEHSKFLFLPEYQYYPKDKAIIQGILEEKCAAKSVAITKEEFDALEPTERGEGKTGSSGK
jgi:dUTP pyrophosphatase